MAVPGFQDFMLPVLQLASERDSIHKSEYDEIISQRLGLTQEDRSELLPSGKQTTYQNRIGWAITFMYKAGLLIRPARATMSITQLGRELLAESPERVDNRLLARYESFRTFRESAKPTGQKPDPDIDDPEEVSPLEQLEQAHKQLRGSLASDLIESMKQMPPAAFEQLVVDVLVAMGYGGTITDAGQAIGKSGDGGIDGVIKEDRLGLDFIYVQAKRWEATILRPQLQGFAGALLGRNAQRGVFITTSDFSKGAVEYAKSLPTNIVLVDGQQLAELMIDYGVGVIDEQTYRVKRVDPEYFGE